MFENRLVNPWMMAEASQNFSKVLNPNDLPVWMNPLLNAISEI